ncbi:MAG: RNA polymerase sigma factor [Deltaproteobacteria bacterium]
MGEQEQQLWRLLEPVYPQVVAFARHLSRSRSDGDDLFQEAVVRAMAKLRDLRDEAAFKAWMYRIVITVHRNRCRRAFWLRFIQLGGQSESGEDAHVSGDYRVAEWSPDAAEASRRIRDALASLPAVQREAIVLFEIEGWRVEEIATLHGISVSTVKSRLARGRARLREHYEAAGATQGIPTLVSGDTR